MASSSSTCSSFQTPTKKATQEGFVLDPSHLWFDPYRRKLHSTVGCQFLRDQNNIIEFDSIIKNEKSEILMVKVTKFGNSKGHLATLLVRDVCESNSPLDEDIFVSWFEKVKEKVVSLDNVGDAKFSIACMLLVFGFVDLVVAIFPTAMINSGFSIFEHITMGVVCGIISMMIVQHEKHRRTEKLLEETRRQVRRLQMKGLETK